MVMVVAVVMVAEERIHGPELNLHTADRIVIIDRIVALLEQPLTPTHLTTRVSGQVWSHRRSVGSSHVLAKVGVPCAGKRGVPCPCASKVGGAV